MENIAGHQLRSLGSVTTHAAERENGGAHAPAKEARARCRRALGLRDAIRTAVPSLSVACCALYSVGVPS